MVGEPINGIGINEGIENLTLLSSLIESGLLCCIYMDLSNNCYTNYWCQTFWNKDIFEIFFFLI